jgi:putative ABC transport system permease protein
VDTLRQDLRFALRSLRRQPGFVAVALLTLALGIGTTTAMFTVVNGVLLTPLPFRDPERLVLVRIESKLGGVFPLPDADFLAWRAEHAAFERIAVFSNTSFNLTGSGTPEVVRGAWASGDFFTTLGLQPQAGRFFVSADDAPGAPAVVVLGYAFWQTRFGGNPAIVGQTIRLNDVPCTVVGVAPPRLSFPRPDLDLWRNRVVGPPPRRGPYYLTGLARLRPDATTASARANLTAVRDAILRQYGGAADWTFQAVPMTDAVVGDARTPLVVLLAAVGALLLIALANVANLLLARASSRQREVALRAALGAGRLRIARQLLTEATLLGIAGGMLGLALASGLTRVLLTLGETIIPRLADVQLDNRVMLFALAVSLLSSVIFGVGPALQASRSDLVEPLRDGQRTGAGRTRRRAQRAFVVAEIALALVLSIGAGLLGRSLVRLQQVDPGFNPERLLTFSLNLPQARYTGTDASRAFYTQLLERLSAVPGVQSAAVGVSLPPDQVTVTDNFTAEGRVYAPGESAPTGTMVVASHAYFQTLGIPLLRGRLFDDRDRAGAEPVVIVSRTLAERYYPNGEAVGRRFRTGGPERPNNQWMQVVGIVDDVRFDGLATQPSPAYYLPFAQHPWSTQFVVVRGALDPSQLVTAVRTAVWSIDSQLPLARIRTMDQMMRNASADVRFRTFVLSCFGALGLLLAVVGVYGVMSHAVSQRAHEMGVRAALGARPRDVIALVMRDALRLALFGLAIGLAAALATTTAAEKLLFGVQPKDVPTFAGAALILTAAALLASWLPARRAARIDPLSAIRDER